MNYNKQAQEVWNSIKTQNLGEISSVAMIEKALRDSAFDEREKIVDNIASKFVIKGKFKLSLKLYWNLIINPGLCLGTYITLLGREAIKTIRSNSY